MLGSLSSVTNTMVGQNVLLLLLYPCPSTRSFALFFSPSSVLKPPKISAFPQAPRPTPFLYALFEVRKSEGASYHNLFTRL